MLSGPVTGSPGHPGCTGTAVGKRYKEGTTRAIERIDSTLSGDQLNDCLDRSQARRWREHE